MTLTVGIYSQGDLKGIFAFHFNSQESLENCSPTSRKMPKNGKKRKNAKKVHPSNNCGTPGAIFTKFDKLTEEGNAAKGEQNRLRSA